MSLVISNGMPMNLKILPASKKYRNFLNTGALFDYYKILHFTIKFHYRREQTIIMVIE